MTETMVSDAVLARLEALTVRQEALEAEVERLRVENARLTATQPSGVSLAAGTRGSTARSSAARPPGGRGPAGAGILKRRGLLAGMAALLGAGLAKLGTADRTEAAHDTGGSPEALHAGVENTTGSSITSIKATVSNAPALAVTNNGITFFTAANDAVQAYIGSATDFSAAVRGETEAEFGQTFGVLGITRSSTAGAAGVRGESNGGYGVFGQSIASAGVRGEGSIFLSSTASGVVGVASGCEFANASNVGVGGSGRGLPGAPANKTGVLGTTDGGVGVQGFAMAGGIGVRGSANAGGGPDFNGNGTGVAGRSGSGTGVRGESTSSIGVHGKSTNNAGVFAQGPIGLYAAGTGVAGVFGGSSGGFGFWGNSATSAGIYGTSTSGPGVRAESTNSFGLHAKGPTYAGVFEGNVFVTGRVIAQGGVGASATATTTTRALAEDVGEATLANGKATVTLGQDFTDAVNGDYRVFLTELADLGGLYVARKGPREFEVRSRGTGQVVASGRFDYRVVAKTAGANTPRQAPLAPPDLTTIKPAPPLPEPPKASEAGASDGRRER